MAKDKENKNNNEITNTLDNELNNLQNETNSSSEISLNDKQENNNEKDKLIGNCSSDGMNIELPKREENPFSLKHFLNREPNTSVASSSGISGLGKDYQNTTGARPKILQSDSNSQMNKMKRSPRFPSFDSQASLNEYKHDENLSMTNLFHSRSNASFTSSSNCGGIGFCGNDDEYNTVNHDFQRSYSNYDIESPHTSPRCERRKNNSARNSEFSSALPDFVQDHLVVEQLYNVFGNSPPASTSPLNIDGVEPDSDFEELYGNLRPEVLPSSSCNDIPFDLTYNSTDHRKRVYVSPKSRRNLRKNLLPTDLTLDLTGTSNENRSGYIFPMSNNDNSDTTNSCDNKMQTLPDFLSDGPIHSSGRLADVAQNLPSHIDSPDDEHMTSTIMLRLRLENERLKKELDVSRRTMSDKTNRIRELERLVENERKSAKLALNVEQIEEDLDRSNKRAAAAQSLVCKLKLQIKELTIQLEKLRRENEMLRDEGNGAVGGSSTTSTHNPSSYHENSSSRTRQFSRELMLAAATAESNLRQLLTGVDNLRMMASALESLDKSNEHTEGYLSDCGNDDDDCTGPAL